MCPLNGMAASYSVKGTTSSSGVLGVGSGGLGTCFKSIDIWGDRDDITNLKIVQVFSNLAYSHICIITNINHTGNFKRDRYPPTTAYDAGDDPNRRFMSKPDIMLVLGGTSPVTPHIGTYNPFVLGKLLLAIAQRSPEAR